MAKNRIRANGEGTIYEEPLNRWSASITIDGQRVEVRAANREQVNAELRLLAKTGSVTSRTRPKQATRWVGQIFVGPRRVKRTGATQAEVVAKLNALKGDRQAGRAAGQGNMTVGDVLDVWWGRFTEGKETVGKAGKDWVQLAPSTRDRYRWGVDLIRKEFGSNRLRELDEDRVENGLARIASGEHGRPLARTSVTRVRAVMVEVLRYAKRKKWVRSNAALDARIGYIGREDRPRAALTAEDASKLWDVCDGKWYGAMFKTMLTTLIRPGEAAGLLENDVDLDAMVVHVQHGRSKNERGKAIAVDHLKTPWSSRTITLPKPTGETLRAHRGTLAAARLAADTWPDEPRFVFPGRHGDIARAEDVSAELTAICKQAGIPRVTPNELRHTAASLASDAGVRLEELADQLGHKDVRMVSQVYRHRIRPTVGDGASATMNKLFSTGTD